MHVVTRFAGESSEGITHLQRWASRSAPILDSDPSNAQRFSNLLEPVPGPADQCPESSLVEHEEVVEYLTLTSLAGTKMSKLQVTEFTSVTEAWCENPLASMLREVFNLPLQSYLLPKSY
eukprot:2968239-Rhodomonas_salina.1